MLIRHSRVMGTACGVLNILTWLYLSACEIYFLRLPASEAPFESRASADFILPFIVVPFLFCSAGMMGSLLISKRPAAGALIMLVSGGLIFFSAFAWRWLVVPSLLSIAAGVLALTSISKVSGIATPQNEELKPGR